jgi:hypothetical protein
MVASFALYLWSDLIANLSTALSYIGLLSSLLFLKTSELKLDFLKNN